MVPSLRRRGFGTLSYNFRGQDKSRFNPQIELTNDLIVEDLCRLIGEVSPLRPILTGVSVGGPYAAQARARGAPAAAFVLLDTLREINPRIAWINDALPHHVATGGAALFMGLALPLLTNPEFVTTVRANCLKDPYTPLDTCCLSKDRSHWRKASPVSARRLKRNEHSR